MNSPLIHPGVDACDPHLQWVEAAQVQWPHGQIRDWLCEQGSLTRLLKLASGDQFRVQVLDEHAQHALQVFAILHHDVAP